MMLSAVRAVASAGLLTGAARATLPAALRLRYSAESDAQKNAEKMVELLTKSPQLQQMMMAAMPAPMRNPEMLKQLLADPAIKQRIASMIASKGMAIPQAVLDKISTENLDETFSKAGKMGLNPVDLFQKLVAYPGLLARLKDPKVMSAFMDISANPQNTSKYESDPDTLEVILKVRDILSSQRPVQDSQTEGKEAIQGTASVAGSTQPSASAAAEATSASASSSAPEPPPPGAAPAVNPLLALLSSTPATAHHCQNPKVVEALNAVHQSPWKTVKYVFDREVMAAFGDLKKLMQGKPV